MADHRTKAQKLRDLIAHPRTSEHERQAARLALDRLGERHEIPKPPPRYQPPRGASPFTSGTFADWFEQMLRTQQPGYQRRWEEELRRQAQEDLRRAAEAKARKQAQIPLCPGCGHVEAEHVMWRCYACHASRARAEWCGWAWAAKKGEEPRWVKVRSGWQTGPYGYADDGP